MKEGDRKFMAIAMPNAVEVRQVRLVDRVGKEWTCLEPGRVVIRDGGKAKHPTWEVDETQLFDSEDEAIAAARRMRPTGKR